MPKLKQGKDCCGCSACMAVCPRGAIDMKPDGLGFLYPQVDLDKCIECGACERVCAFSEEYPTPENFAEPKPYGVRHRDMAEIMRSRSGGMFCALSDYVLAQGGVVYGAGYEGHFEVAHKRATTKDERDEMRGSKYTQSRMGDTFRRVRDDLKAGRMVLFSGTPCQTSGLRSYIGEKLSENLILVDIVCHSTPSPYVWRDYLEWREKQSGSRVAEVRFRDKSKLGWTAHKETLLFENGESVTSDAYTYLFQRVIMNRPSCEVCRFTNTRRPADITLADFWGWEKSDPSFNADDRGVSLVLVNTPKGARLFEAVRGEINVIEPKLEDCLQLHLRQPSVPSPQSEAFRNDYMKKGFLYVARKYGNMGARFRAKREFDRIKKGVKRRVRRLVPDPLVAIIKGK